MNATEAEVRAELERILASKGFGSTGRLSRLLRYVVERTLAGDADQLKEFVVGVEVFDRNASYDPRLDSIVRVEAGRLRSRLDEYYRGEGGASPVRIQLPKGGYSARFERPQAPLRDTPAPAIRALRWATWPITVAFAAVVMALVVWLGFSQRAPAQTDNADVAVLPFSSGAAESGIAARLTENVTAELARLGTVSVVSHTSALQFTARQRPLREIASMLNADFVVEASVELDAGGLLVVTRLVDAETDRKVWVSDYRGERGDTRALAQRLAFDVSTEVTKRQSR